MVKNELPQNVAEYYKRCNEKKAVSEELKALYQKINELEKDLKDTKDRAETLLHEDANIHVPNWWDLIEPLRRKVQNHYPNHNGGSSGSRYEIGVWLNDFSNVMEMSFIRDTDGNIFIKDNATGEPIPMIWDEEKFVEEFVRQNAVVNPT